MSYKKVHILLSTYNGEKYLDEQLDSILKQKYKNFIIHVRDDGSTDDTCKLLEKWRKKYPNQFNICFEKNIGVIKSFLSLLKRVDYKHGDLFAFCDQDDVWLPNKLQLAVNAFKKSTSPKSTLYCTRLEYVDENLKYLYESLIPSHIGFNNAIIENIATGCTVVFGSEIKRLLLQANPQHMMMHDWWAYLIASTFGHIIYDDTATIKYRQHNTTVTPQREFGFSRILTRIINFFIRLKSETHIGLQSLDQASYFVKTYKNIPKKNKKILYELLEMREKGTLKKRIYYIFKPKVFRTDPVENILLKPMILFGLH